MSLSILLVDDHPVFLFGLRALIETQPDMLIAGESGNGEQALNLAREKAIDLVILDVNLPDMSGLEVIRRLRISQPGIHILVLSMLDDETVIHALEAGADGYIVKGAGGEETLRAIRAVAAGEAIFSPAVARYLHKRYRQPLTTEAFPELTPRERQILELLASGLTNSAIAERLSLSNKTVRNRVSDIFMKLQVNSRGEAILKARQVGMGSGEIS